MRQRLINSFLRHKFLVFIILLASVLRFILPGTPPSLNWDEVSHGYNAYSILTTGTDEWGEFMPIIFRAYGDYKLPAYIYLTAASEFLFGLTIFAVRLPSVLAGIGTVTFTYFLMLEMLNRKPKDNSLYNYNWMASAAALLVAVEPWSFFLSRAAFEANLALFFFVSGIYYFLKFVNANNSKFDLLKSALLLGLTVWTYNSYRIFTPLMVLTLCFIYKKALFEIYTHKKRLVIFASLLLSVFFVPMFIQLGSPVGQARYSWVGILDQGSINNINEARGAGCSRLICNKYTYTVREFEKNYLSHFSPNFLFIKGGSQYQFSVPGHGLLYLINLPLTILGIIFLAKTKLIPFKSKLLIVAWTMLAPISSSLTREAPHVLRSVTFIPIPMMLSVLGLYAIISLLPKFKIALSLGVVVLFLFAFESYMSKYFNNYHKDYSESWQYGYLDASRFIKENYHKYDKIVFTKKYGEPHEFLLFNLSWNSRRYNTDPNLNRFAQSNWFWVDGFDKFYFVNDWEITEERLDRKVFISESKKEIDCTAVRCLLITGGDIKPSNWETINTINFLNGKTAFIAYED
jgi:4-amino-4-deoxy-L-arabinose transferase-like glycosyltransferase